MAESTLAVSFTNLQTEVSYYLGYGRDTSVLTANQLSFIASIIDSGLRRFYSPAKVDPRRSAHEWTFLKPTTTVVAFADVTGTASGQPVKDNGTSTVTATTSVFYPGLIGMTLSFDTSGTEYTITGYTSGTVITVSGDASGETTDDTFAISTTSNYRLPDGFGGMLGRVSFGSGTGYEDLDIKGEGTIRELRAISNTTGVPSVCAIRPVYPTPDGSTGQRFELMVYPEPSSDHTLSYRYLVLPDQLSGSALYALGGMMHTETVKESCLAVAEEMENPESATHRNAYAKRLIASVESDRKRGPRVIGDMRDDLRALDKRDRANYDHNALWDNQLW